MISRKFLNTYQKEVDQASKEASLYVKSAYQVFMEQNPNISFIEIRNYVLEAINDSLSIFGGQASLIANDFFDQLAEMAGEDITSEMYQNVNMERVNKSLHYYAKNLVEGNNDKFEKNIVDLTAFHVKREAFENLKYNCKKNGLAYARVPSGRETCAFCFILSSRGFCYDSEFSAGGKGNKYHPHCDCIIVPGFGVGSGVDPDKQIEGYKPTEMKKRYEEVCATVQYFCTLEKYSESGAYKKYGYNFSEWKLSIINSELRKRDKKWLWSGKLPSVDYKKPFKEFIELDKNKAVIKKDGWKDVFAHKALQKSGFSVVVRKEDSPKGYSNIDLEINGQLWEIKSPDGGSKRQVKNAFAKADRQFATQYKTNDPIRVVFNGKYSLKDDDWLIKKIKSCEQNRKNIESILYITKEGKVLKLK